MATSPSERRGIPEAPFVHDVQTYLSQSGLETNAALATLQERLQQYKLAEMKLLAQRRDLQAKVPDIKKCLAIVESLISKQGTGEETRLDFELAEGLYAQALIPETQTVCLWLGANVMLEYNCDEAEALLRKNLENAHISLQAIIEDMQFLRDQVTITEEYQEILSERETHERYFTDFREAQEILATPHSRSERTRGLHSSDVDLFWDPQSRSTPLD